MAQPKGFLDLPREIRDQIYDLILVSPTNLIEAVYPSPASSSHTNRFIRRPKPSRLAVVSCCGKSKSPVPSSDYTLPSLSICRTNRQIHEETEHIFYERNALFVSQPLLSTSNCPDVLRILKAMGQTSSRLITKIVFNMPNLDKTSKLLPKIFQALNSRARRGSFRTLELRWQGASCVDLIATHNAWKYAAFWDMTGTWALLKMMDDMKPLWKFDRAIVFPEVMKDEEELKAAGLMLNGAFGGRMFFGDTCVAEDGKVIGSDVDPSGKHTELPA